jgi:hypothetical protein
MRLLFDRAPVPRHRLLLVRGDLDGLVAAALLRAAGAVQEVAFVRARDARAGRVVVGGGTIAVGLPALADSVALAFVADAHGSAARAVHDRLGGRAAFPALRPELLDAADACAHGSWTPEEILAPTGWTLLDRILDPRTRLGSWRSFRLCDGAFRLRMIDLVRLQDPEAILCDRHVSERVRLLVEHEGAWHALLRRRSVRRGEVLLVDLRGEGRVVAGDPLAADALAPDARCVVSCRDVGAGGVELRVRRGTWARGALPDLVGVLGAAAEEGDASEVVLRMPAADADARLDAVLRTLDARGTPLRRGP